MLSPFLRKIKPIRKTNHENCHLFFANKEDSRKKTVARLCPRKAEFLLNRRIFGIGEKQQAGSMAAQEIL